MRKNLMRKHAGFTMVELVVVMVIVGILAVISVPMYRNYIDRARAQEGYALMGSIISAQKVYWAEHGEFYNIGPSEAGNCPILGVNAAGNTYHDSWEYGTMAEETGQVATTGNGTDGYTGRVAGTFGIAEATVIGDSITETTPW